ncbi:MAG TPA: FMN-binding protein, partial [Methylomirabilota bacterium]|nr:FMN-binding protein [Methylomirabilota bacterium]
MATALGLVLLFSFKTPDAPTDSSLPLAVAHGTPAPVATAPPGGRTSSPPRATGPASSPPAPSAQPPTGGNHQVDGDVIPTQFGDIQVRVVESGGKIVDVKALQLPSDRRRSAEISQYSEPILHDEALQAQSA